MVEVYDNNLLVLQGRRNLMTGLWHIDVSEEGATASKMMSMRAVLPQVHLESMRDK